MKIKIFILLFLVCCLGGLSLAAPKDVGTLKVVCDNENAEIYIDGLMAGYHLATIDSLLPGSHYVEVKLDGKKIYGQMVLIQQGKQNTIFVKSDGKNNAEKSEEDKSKPSLFFSFSYGTYDIKINVNGTSASGPAQGNAFGLGLGIKKCFNQFNQDSVYSKVGVNYNFKVDPNQISYIFAGIGVENEIAFSEIGINYSLINNDNLSINGGIGYQISAGFNLVENIKIGLKYAIFNGSGYYLGEPYTVSFSQPMIFVSI